MASPSSRVRRVVVTGARGFLGGHLVTTARARGAEVLGIVRQRDGGSREDPSTLGTEELLQNPARLDGTDIFVHAAAVRHRHGASAASYRASNVDLVEALVRAAAGRVGRFVLVSSVGVYGFPKARDLPITERTPFAPATLYSWTKIEAERLVQKLGRELGLAVTIVRPTIIYGPGDTNGMLDKLARMIRARRYLLVGDGRNTLHHTYIDDVASGILDLAERDAAKNDHFIVAGPETTTLADLSQKVARALGRSVPKLHVPLAFARGVASIIDVMTYRGLAFTAAEPPINNEKLDVMTVSIAFDPRKARDAGYVPKVGYDEGIARTLAPAESAG